MIAMRWIGMFGIGRLCAGLALSAVAVSYSVLPAAAQSFPGRPVTIIVPYGAGGGVSINTMALAPYLEKVLGQKVLVEHRAGAGGVTGSTLGAFAKPDGYTLTMVSSGIAYAPWLTPGIKYSPESYAYIGQVSFVPNFLAVNAESPYKTLKDLVAAMKAKPGTLAVGKEQGWPSPDVALAIFSARAGVKAKLVSGYKGGAARLAALMGNHLDLSFNNVNELLPQVGGDKVRILAASAPERSKFIPDVPTFRELGYDVSVGVWRTLAAPKDTPKPVLDVLRKALKEALGMPGIAEDFKKVGLTIDYLDADATKKLIHSEYEEAGKLFTELGINLKTKK
jgi:tripartite-type tricarboxylate transporter receptor subunit TctC